MDSPKSTKELENELKGIESPSDLYGWIDGNGIEDKNRRRFAVYFAKLCEEKNIRLSKLAERVALSRPYIYACANGTKNYPAKDVVLKLGFGINATLEEMNRLLKLSGHKELYARNEEDAIIIFGIENGYDLYQIDELLAERGIKLRLTDKD